MGEQAGTHSKNAKLHSAHYFSHYFADQMANATTKKITKDTSGFAQRNSPKCFRNITVAHGGFPVGANRRMKAEFPKATSSPSGHHFSTFNNFRDASCSRLATETLVAMMPEECPRNTGTESAEHTKMTPPAPQLRKNPSLREGWTPKPSKKLTATPSLQVRPIVPLSGSFLKFDN